MNVLKISKEEWKEKFSKNAHLSVFKEILDPECERIDFANLIVDKNEKLTMYATVCELDSDTAYLNFGGSFPTSRSSLSAVKAFRALISDLFRHYQFIGFHCENDNHAVLKLALHSGFRIIGVSYSSRTGKVLLEHRLEREQHFGITN